MDAVGACDRVAGVRATVAPMRSSDRAFDVGPIPDGQRVAAFDHAFGHRAAQQSRSQKRHLRRSPYRASRYNLPRRCARLKPSRSCCSAILVTFGLLPTSGAADAPIPFRWAGDPEGGAPFVEADPSRPDALVGFDVEIADLLARALGRSPEFINIQFTSIDQSIDRGDAEIGLSGIEDTPARRAQPVGHRALLRIPRGPERPQRRRRPHPFACRPSRQGRRHAERDDRVRNPRAGRAGRRTSRRLVR